MQSYFIIGTDTDCGKTYVTCEILKSLNHAIAIKPIQSGGTGDTDKLAAQQPHYSKSLARWSFEPAISPHIAAQQASETITFDALDTFCHAHSTGTHKTLLIETTGGVMCPINQTQTWLDYLVHRQKPVMFVVGLRLGCLNHALLTAHALKTHQIPCVGWIANICSPTMEAIRENLQTLHDKLPFKHLATIPFNGTIAHPKSFDSLYEEWILTD